MFFAKVELWGGSMDQRTYVILNTGNTGQGNRTIKVDSQGNSDILSLFLIANNNNCGLYTIFLAADIFFTSRIMEH